MKTSRQANCPTHPDNLRIYGDNPYVGDLIKSIKEHGFLRPIVIDQDKRIIDGVRRWTASKNLELETAPCETREYADKDSAISAILNYNIYRHKTPRQVFNESREVKRIETEKARKRQDATRFGSEIGNAEVGSTEGNVRDIVASFFKMGRSKFKELETVFESEDVYLDIAEKVADGTWSVHRGYAKIVDTIQKQKDVEEMKAKISEALSHVKRESLREKLEEKYLSDESDLSKTSIKDVKTEIDKELGLHVGPTDLEQWKEIKGNFLKPVNQYKENSSSREWSSEDRK